MPTNSRKHARARRGSGGKVGQGKQTAPDQAQQGDSSGNMGTLPEDSNGLMAQLVLRQAAVCKEHRSQASCASEEAKALAFSHLVTMQGTQREQIISGSNHHAALPARSFGLPEDRAALDDRQVCAALIALEAAQKLPDEGDAPMSAHNALMLWRALMRRLSPDYAHGPAPSANLEDPDVNHQHKLDPLSQGPALKPDGNAEQAAGEPGSLLQMLLGLLAWLMHWLSCVGIIIHETVKSAGQAGKQRGLPTEDWGFPAGKFSWEDEFGPGLKLLDSSNSRPPAHCSSARQTRPIGASDAEEARAAHNTGNIPAASEVSAFHQSAAEGRPLGGSNARHAPAAECALPNIAKAAHDAGPRPTAFSASSSAQSAAHQPSPSACITHTHIQALEDAMANLLQVAANADVGSEVASASSVQ